MEISLTVNEQVVRVAAPGSARLLDVLRDDLYLTGTKRGCETGHCGACSVLLDGVLVTACTILAAECEGASVTTIEGANAYPATAYLARAFIEKDAFQCGYCTPGMMISALALLSEDSRPTREDVLAGISGNLCRCTGYGGYVAAILEAGEALQEGHE